MPASDTKISLLPTLTTPHPLDLLMVVHNPSTEPTSMGMTLATLLGSISTPLVTSSNVTLGGANATLTISVNTVNLTSNITHTKTLTGNVASFTSVHVTQSTPASSNVGVLQGKMWFDSDYVYCAVSNTEIKRVALTSF